MSFLVNLITIWLGSICCALRTYGKTSLHGHFGLIYTYICLILILVFPSHAFARWHGLKYIYHWVRQVMTRGRNFTELITNCRRLLLRNWRKMNFEETILWLLRSLILLSNYYSSGLYPLFPNMQWSACIQQMPAKFIQTGRMCMAPFNDKHHFLPHWITVESLQKSHEDAYGDVYSTIGIWTWFDYKIRWGNRWKPVYPDKTGNKVFSLGRLRRQEWTQRLINSGYCPPPKMNWKQTWHAIRTNKREIFKYSGDGLLLFRVAMVIESEELTSMCNATNESYTRIIILLKGSSRAAGRTNRETRSDWTSKCRLTRSSREIANARVISPWRAASIQVFLKSMCSVLCMQQR